MKNINIEIFFKNKETEEILKNNNEFLKSEIFNTKIKNICEKILIQYANEINGKLVNNSKDCH